MSNDTDGDQTPASTHQLKPTPRVRTARKGPAAVRQSSTRGFDFLDKITQSLDPEHQLQRETERASVFFQSQQLILFHSQIRDLNQLVQTLRSQLDDAERRRVDADRRADRLQNQIDIAAAVNRAQVQQSSHREPAVTVISSDSDTGSPSPDHDHRWEAIYRDGGRTSWFGNGNRLDSDVDVLKVNRIPWSPTPPSPTQSPPLSDTEY